MKGAKEVYCCLRTPEGRHIQHPGWRSLTSDSPGRRRIKLNWMYLLEGRLYCYTAMIWEHCVPVLWKLSHKTNCISVDGFDEDQERTFTSRASCCVHKYTRSNELTESVLGWAINRVHSWSRCYDGSRMLSCYPTSVLDDLLSISVSCICSDNMITPEMIGR